MKKVTCEQLASWMKETKVTLIDVRTPEEFEAEFISGALFMPLSQFDPRDIKIDGKIIVYCRSGVRSEAACRLVLAEHAEAEVYNLEGGILRWKKSGFETNQKELF